MNKYFIRSSFIGLTALIGAESKAISLDFNSISGPNVASRGSIKFDGATDTFSFVNVSAPGAAQGYSLTLSGSDESGDSFGDLGNIIGTFKIGPITTTGTKQTAQVSLDSGAGVFTIKDHNGFLLSGNIDWVEIYTDGTAGGLNSGGSINLSNISYQGTEADLLALGKEASVSLQFGFNPAKSLKDLTADPVTKMTVRGPVTIPNINNSTFTGDIYSAPVPEGGSTIVLLSSALAACAGISRKRARG